MKKILVLLALVFIASCASNPERAGVPQFKVDPFWPKPLPGNWMLGQVAGIAVDKNDNVWIVHRPATLLDDEKGALKNPPETKCCTAAPPVLQFDSAGQPAAQLGRAGAGLRLAGERARHLRRQRRQRLGRRQRHEGPPHPQVHARRQVPAAARQARQVRGLQQPPRSSSAGRRTCRWTPRPTSSTWPTATATGASWCSTRRRFAYKRHWGAYGERPHDDKLPPYDPRAALMRSFAQPGALRAHLQRRPGLRLRPRQRPHPGVREERQVRARVPSSSPRRCRTARCGTWCSPRTRRRSTSSSPTARTAT